MLSRRAKYASSRRQNHARPRIKSQTATQKPTVAATVSSNSRKSSGPLRRPCSFDRLGEALAHDGLGRVECLAVLGVEVAVEDPEHVDAVDRDVEALGCGNHLDHARSILGEGVTDSTCGLHRAVDGQDAKIRGPKGYDVTIEEPDCRRRRRSLCRGERGGRG